MFLKRVYNTIRFWQAIFSQLIFPLLFVLLALILAVTLPNNNENDPPRALTVENSGLDSSMNRIFFYAEFGENPRNVFQFEVSSRSYIYIYASTNFVSLSCLSILCVFVGRCGWDDFLSSLSSFLFHVC